MIKGSFTAQELDEINRILEGKWKTHTASKLFPSYKQVEAKNKNIS